MTSKRCAPQPRVLASAALALAVLSAAGCSGASGAGAQRLRDHVASELHVALNRHGVPLEDGALSCEGPAADGSVRCIADTAYEPQQEIEATFTADSAVTTDAGLPPSCPGTLRITVGTAPLATAPEDPCG